MTFGAGAEREAASTTGIRRVGQGIAKHDDNVLEPKIGIIRVRNRRVEIIVPRANVDRSVLEYVLDIALLLNFIWGYSKVSFMVRLMTY